MVLKSKGLMPGKKPGFGLLEVVIALSLLAALASVVLPNFVKRQSGYERKQFVTRLNALMSEVWQRSLLEGRLQRVFFDFKERKIFVQEQKKLQTKEFDQVVLYQAENNFQWPESIEIKEFFVNQKDEMAAYGDTQTLWFFVVPSGVAQEVIINFIDTKEATVDKDGKETSLVLNPFTLQFRVYDVFQVPAA
jgi:prepilin-type N-terminal cleavage/methylation domain-containing protein